MNNFPTLAQFLDLIDPQARLGRQKVISDITAVVFLRAVADSKGLLPLNLKQELENILKNSQDLDIDKIYNLFSQAGKKTEFLKTISSISYSTTREYIKTQFDALNETQKQNLITDFPDLKYL